MLKKIYKLLSIQMLKNGSQNKILEKGHSTGFHQPQPGMAKGLAVW